MIEKPKSLLLTSFEEIDAYEPKEKHAISVCFDEYWHYEPYRQYDFHIRKGNRKYRLVAIVDHSHTSAVDEFVWLCRELNRFQWNYAVCLSKTDAKKAVKLLKRLRSEIWENCGSLQKVVEHIESKYGYGVWLEKTRDDLVPIRMITDESLFEDFIKNVFEFPVTNNG